MKAVVVFHDSKHPYRFYSFFKKGFRHCFVCLSYNGLWIQVDSKNGIPYVKYLCVDDEFDLVDYYKGLSYTALQTTQQEPKGFNPFAVRNCTGLVSAMLCINKWWIVTPYQLFKYLRSI